MKIPEHLTLSDWVDPWVDPARQYIPGASASIAGDLPLSPRSLRVKHAVSILVSARRRTGIVVLARAWRQFRLASRRTSGDPWKISFGLRMLFRILSKKMQSKIRAAWTLWNACIQTYSLEATEAISRLMDATEAHSRLMRTAAICLRQSILFKLRCLSRLFLRWRHVIYSDQSPTKNEVQATFTARASIWTAFTGADDPSTAAKWFPILDDEELQAGCGDAMMKQMADARALEIDDGAPVEYEDNREQERAVSWAHHDLMKYHGSQNLEAQTPMTIRQMLDQNDLLSPRSGASNVAAADMPDLDEWDDPKSTELGAHPFDDDYISCDDVTPNVSQVSFDSTRISHDSAPDDAVLSVSSS